MGADVLPSIARELPEAILSRVSRMVLMSPSYHALLKFRFIGWLGHAISEQSGCLLHPDVEYLATRFAITFLAGDKETISLLDQLPEGIATTDRLPGGHHYGGDYAALADRVMAEVTGSPS
jgi:type IV secretory pathway VirJ component